MATALDPVNDPRWRRLVERSPDATAFHHPSWLGLLGRQYRYEMTSLCVEDERGELAAGLPLARVRSVLTGARLVALPFSDACPPLVAAGAGEAALDALHAGLADAQRSAGVPLEVRSWLPELGGGVSSRFYNHTLALGPDIAAVEAGFSKSQVKRGIKKAVREGVTIARATSRDALDAFYRLHVQTRRHQGVPTQPRRFIRRFEQLFDDGLGFVLTASWEDRPVAAAVFLAYNGTLIYKYGASDRDRLALRPNNLLFMEAIRWGCEHGMRELDFGRTDMDNEGLRNFKKAWGTQEQVLGYTRLPAATAGAPAERPGSAPLGFVIRRSPAVVGQAVGTVLYRHVG